MSVRSHNERTDGFHKIPACRNACQTSQPRRRRVMPRKGCSRFFRPARNDVERLEPPPRPMPRICCPPSAARLFLSLFLFARRLNSTLASLIPLPISGGGGAVAISLRLNRGASRRRWSRLNANQERVRRVLSNPGRSFPGLLVERCKVSIPGPLDAWYRGAFAESRRVSRDRRRASSESRPHPR